MPNTIFQNMQNNQMNQVSNMVKNPYQSLMQMANINPQAQQIINALQSGTSAETLAKQLMQQKGINPNQFINMLKNMR